MRFILVFIFFSCFSFPISLPGDQTCPMLHTQEEAKEFAHQFIQDHDFPLCENVFLSGSGEIWIMWNEFQLEPFKQINSQLFVATTPDIVPRDMMVVLNPSDPSQSRILVSFYEYECTLRGYDVVEDYLTRIFRLSDLGI